MPRAKKAKQTRLSFAPKASTPNDTSGPSANDETARQATLRYGHPSMPVVRPARSKPGNVEGLADPFVTDATEEKKSSLEEGKKRKKKKKSGRKDKKKDQISQTPPPADVEVQADQKDESEANKDTVHKKTKKRKLKSKKAPSADVESQPAETSDNELPSQPRERKKKKRDSKRKKAPTPEEAEAPPDDDSESDIPIPPSVRKKPATRDLKRKRSPTPSDIPNSPQNSAGPKDSDAEEVVAPPRRKLRRGAAPPPTIVLDDSSEDEPVASSPAKRRLLKKSPEVPQTPRRNLGQDEIDIEEDLVDLQDSVVKDTRTRGRLANSARAQRMQHLEALRRRRAGEKESDDEQSGSEDESSAAESESGESESEESSIQQPRFNRQRADSDVESSIASDEDLDRYEDDFILEDEGDKLGVPTGLEEMPIQFSRHSYKQLKDYFQDAVEWMVMNQLNPAFPRSSPFYEVAFTKLEDEVKGRTGSQLLSSVWNPNFRRALMARPHIEETAYPITDNHPCDACNRSGHPASFDIKFYGKAYSLKTLEPLTDEESDQEKVSQEDDGQERDKDGYVLPDEDTRFYLGRHCKNKATMAHTLTHWRFHLNEWVTDHLLRTGYLSDESILERSHWSQRKKEKYATEAMGLMVHTDEVKKLWRDFHITLRTARESTTIN